MISGTKGGYSELYTSISFTSQHSATRGADQLKEVREQEKLETIASNQALEADLVAYWSDNECLPQEQDPILRNGGSIECAILFVVQNMLLLFYHHYHPPTNAKAVPVCEPSSRGSTFGKATNWIRFP